MSLLQQTTLDLPLVNPAQPRPNLDKLAEWIMGGWDTITPEMTVCRLHAVWDDAWCRADRAERCFRQFAHRCRERLKTASKVEKPRLRQSVAEALVLAEIAHDVPTAVLQAAQERYNETLDLTDDQQEAFWMDVDCRPGIEQTWEMTLQAVADWIKQNV